MPIVSGNIPIPGRNAATPQGQAMALGAPSGGGSTSYVNPLATPQGNGQSQITGNWWDDLNNYQNNPQAAGLVQAMQNGTLDISNGQIMVNGQTPSWAKGIQISPGSNGQYNLSFADPQSEGSVNVQLGTNAQGAVTSDQLQWKGGQPGSVLGGGLGEDLLLAGGIGLAAFTGGASLGLLGGDAAALGTGAALGEDAVGSGDLLSILPGAVDTAGTAAGATLASGLPVDATGAGLGSFGVDTAVPTTMESVGATQSLASTLPGAVGGAAGAAAGVPTAPSILQQLGGVGGAIKTGLGALSVGEGLYGIGAASRANSTNNTLNPQINSLGPYSQQAAAQLMALQQNPSSVTSTPGYQAGLEAVQQSDAAKGTFGSGNTLRDLQNYGQQAYQQQFNNLMSIATGGSNTASAATGANNASTSSYLQQLTQALSALSFGGSLVGNSLNGVNAANNNPSNTYSPTGSY